LEFQSQTDEREFDDDLIASTQEYNYHESHFNHVRDIKMQSVYGTEVADYDIDFFRGGLPALMKQRDE
jgi:hypothetical protein